ncbi:phage head closure protein [Zavarzinia aquatilis]|uniref:phage head closure protein n=1 Tax=Zavarzinia aquatilis TaxID=2211142 RepID=UPI001402944A|nr:phage head closure protein [Zavarzinia aquatilis]
MIGRLRERIAFERPVLGDDGAGGGSLSWLPVDALPEVWAEVEATTGSEPVEADARRAEVNWRITLRARDDLSSDWRLVWRGRVLDILAILPRPRRDYMVLLAREGAGQ